MNISRVILPALFLSIVASGVSGASGAYVEAAASPLAPTSSYSGHVRFERLTVEDGLSHSTALSILQDHEGFMWFATQDGLNKYDGYAFTVYRHDEADPHSLSNNNIFALYETRDGALWIGANQALYRAKRSERNCVRVYSA